MKSRKTIKVAKVVDWLEFRATPENWVKESRVEINKEFRAIIDYIQKETAGKKTMNAGKLIEWLTHRAGPRRIMVEAWWVPNTVKQWVKMETEPHKCLSCSKMLPAGEHYPLCSFECEVAAA